MSRDRNPLIALSAGGSDAELAACGIGMEHVNELMVRMAYKLLRRGDRLCFGGTLGNPEQELTQHLIDAAQNWLSEEAAEASKTTDPTTWPLVNYAAWPHYQRISDEFRAEMVGICHFINVDPPNIAGGSLLADSDHPDAPAASQVLAANALSAMRDQSTAASDLRIVWAGKISGSSGWLAGILEEVFCSIQAGKPLLVLGGFGGCAGLIARYLQDPAAAWPSELSLDACAASDRDALLSREAQASVEARFAAVRHSLQEFRERLHQEDAVNGVSSQQFTDGLSENTSRKAAALAAEVAARISD